MEIEDGTGLSGCEWDGRRMEEKDGTPNGQSAKPRVLPKDGKRPKNRIRSSVKEEAETPPWKAAKKRFGAGFAESHRVPSEKGKTTKQLRTEELSRRDSAKKGEKTRMSGLLHTTRATSHRKRRMKLRSARDGRRYAGSPRNASDDLRDVFGSL